MATYNKIGSRFIQDGHVLDDALVAINNDIKNFIAIIDVAQKEMKANEDKDSN